jgi:phage/plasmid-associated DNA primase
MNFENDDIVELIFDSVDLIALQLPLTTILADLLLALPKTLTFIKPGSTDIYCVYSFANILPKQRKFINYILSSGYFRKMSKLSTSSLYHGGCYINDCISFPEAIIRTNEKPAQLPLFILSDLISEFKSLKTKEDIEKTTQPLDDNEKITVKKLIDDFIEGKSWDDLLSKLYSIVAKNRFMYDEINDEWYLINRYNIWNNIGKEGYILMNDIREVLNPIIEEELKNLEKQYLDICKAIKEIEKNGGNADELFKQKDEIKKKIKMLKIVCKKIHTVTSKKQILTSLKGRQPINRIYEKFDNVNLDLFAFNNGVYDLQKRIFRLPLPSELITATCGYDYEDAIKLGPMIDDINKIISSITLNEQDKSSLLMEIAQCLSASGVIEAFYLWIGDGGNGKGVLRDLISQTFGLYFDAMNIEYLLKSKNNSSATGADDIMAKKKNCRIVITTEPDSNAELKIDKLKQISGGDPVQCRFLYGKSFNYVPRWKLFLQSNFEIKMPNSAGKSQIRRAHVTRFPFNFTDNPVLANDKIADNTIKTRIRGPLYNIAFFHILLESYYKWIDGGRNFNYSDNIKEQTQMLLMENDPITPFIENYIIKTGNVNDKIKNSELYEKFKKLINGETHTVNSQEFKSGMSSKGFPVKMLDGYVIYRGIQFNTEKYNKFMEDRKKAKNEDFDL